MDHHEAAAADIAGARIGDRHGEADRHGGVHRVAAAIENLHADTGGAAFLRHHHAVAGDDRLCRGNRQRLPGRRDLGVSGGAQQQESARKDLNEAVHY